MDQDVKVRLGDADEERRVPRTPAGTENGLHGYGHGSISTPFRSTETKQPEKGSPDRNPKFACSIAAASGSGFMLSDYTGREGGEPEVYAFTGVEDMAKWIIGHLGA